MNILVTGGQGYIGTRLVPKLLEGGHKVRVLDKLVFGSEGLAPCQDQIEMVVDDIRTVGPEVFDGMDAVVHLAGLSNDPTAEYNVEANKSINADGTIRLARLAKEAKVRRFVFASSCSIYYSHNPDDRIKREDDPVEPRAPYSWSKREAELGLMALTGNGFCPVALRKGTVFGQAPRMRYDLVINTFTRDAFAKRRLTIHAGGRMWRPMLHIDDAVEAYLAAVAAPDEAVCGRIFNVLSGNFAVIKLAHEVRRALEGHKGIRLDLDVQQVGISRSYRVDGSRFEQAVGFAAGHDISTAVDEMWDSLESGVDYDNAVYYNIRWLELLCSMEERLRSMGGGPLSTPSQR